MNSHNLPRILPRSSTQILRSLVRSSNFHFRPTSSCQSSDSNKIRVKKMQWQSNKFLEHDAEQKELLNSLGVDYLDGSVEVVNRPTRPGEYAISRERYEKTVPHRATEEELKANGEALEEASRHGYGY